MQLQSLASIVSHRWQDCQAANYPHPAP